MAKPTFSGGKWKIRGFAARVAIVAIPLMGTPAHAQEQAVIVVGPSDYPPYTYLEDGLPSGIFPEIIAELSDRIDGYRIEIHNLPWKRALKSVEMGNHIAVFPPYRWPGQRPWMTAYSEPLVQETVAVYCQPEVIETARPRWPDDYFGLTIGLGLGSLAAGPSFFEAAEAGSLTHRPIPLESIIPHLLSREVDCVVQDDYVLRYHYRRYTQLRAINEPFEARARLGAQISTHWAHLGFSSDPKGLFPYQDDFLRKLNIAIRAMRTEGRIDAIVATND